MDSDSSGLGWAQDFLCLTSSQVMMILLAGGPHYKNHHAK